jgi:hypothetical protein
MKLLRSPLKILSNSKVCSASCINICISVTNFLFFLFLIFYNVPSEQFSGSLVAFDKNFTHRWLSVSRNKLPEERFLEKIFRILISDFRNQKLNFFKISSTKGSQKFSANTKGTDLILMTTS